MSIITTVRHHGGSVRLPAGRYWIGDIVSLEARLGQTLPEQDDTAIDAMLVRDGDVAGMYCAGLWQNAVYVPDPRQTSVEGSDRHVRTAGDGLAILRIDDGTGTDAVTVVAGPNEFVGGLLVSLPTGGFVVRAGRQGGDVIVSSLADGGIHRHGDAVTATDAGENVITLWLMDRDA